jgi:hypothetical protein
MAISITANAGIDGCSTIAFDQDAITTDTLLAAQGVNTRIAVIGFLTTLDAGGTVQFIDGASANHSGILDVAAQCAVGWKGNLREPLWVMPDNSALKIVTTGGKASGFVKLRVILGN